MKKTLVAALFLSAAFGVQAQDIRFAMEPSYPPFEMTNEKGEIIGFDVDIANAICKEIQANCSFQSQPFDSLIQGLKQKRFDAAISGMGITEARKKQVLFSEPYFSSSAAFIAKKGTDFANLKNIGVQNGTTYQNYISKEKPGYQVKSYASYQEAILDIQNGRIDAIFGDIPVLVDMIDKTPGLEFVGEKINNPTYFGNGLGIATNLKNQALVDELNKGLSTIKTNGEYQKIYDKWMTAK
ncbi:arginine ABC transporter substrate-binding protein [Actinobacillus succinogenes]|uniref:Extracellular solute-binding protein family 3 n=1 Tax=Actinobacillus succinogenes (strain ATCC 55618 / DSM 22257 / CCUG 43843 / 130Z) TaxID=339671 RepID=A6VQB1_ACTSZ|nr:arginine ABC transporter substrate-binding protein [Actinobacillus succinogenes]ABR75158.1 extracellular solute-binding protein family 3 [Actinobacillus succinogenes 130Z]PHI40445.1 arginine ABC transporter substrate-binding protein [Actinobacillus succinogenes]